MIVAVSSTCLAQLWPIGTLMFSGVFCPLGFWPQFALGCKECQGLAPSLDVATLLS